MISHPQTYLSSKTCRETRERKTAEMHGMAARDKKNERPKIRMVTSDDDDEEDMETTARKKDFFGLFATIDFAEGESATVQDRRAAMCEFDARMAKAESFIADEGAHATGDHFDEFMIALGFGESTFVEDREMKRRIHDTFMVMLLRLRDSVASKKI
jgi:hypothetical protein